MDAVAEQYEAYPYPERDPAEEARRLIEGSPSDRLEIDHYLFAGRRDWSRPFRALFAGGGTGDGTIMLAQQLADLGCPAEITWLDRSAAAMAVARARARARRLEVTFHLGDILEAPEIGPFDYIDCCGVIHHLADPDAGLAALAAALSPEGGIGLMVYAPYGRTGVYPLQEAFAALMPDEPPRERLAMARLVVEHLPQTNWLRLNARLGDHRLSDAGFYDLLLHGRDRPYAIEALLAALERAGLAPVSMLEPALYEPLRYLPRAPEIVARAEALAPAARMGLAERLSGAIKTHVLYAVPAGDASRRHPKLRMPRLRMARAAADDALVPHLKADAAALGAHLAEHGRVTVSIDGVDYPVVFHHEGRSGPPAPAYRRDLLGRMISLVDGRRTLAEIGMATGRGGPLPMEPWQAIERALGGFNLLHYSRTPRP